MRNRSDHLAYVIYPAALFDGWEVVVDGSDETPVHFDALEEATAYAERAAAQQNAEVRLENWFGDTEAAWRAPADAGDRSCPTSRFPCRVARSVGLNTLIRRLMGQRG